MENAIQKLEPSSEHPEFDSISEQRDVGAKAAMQPSRRARIVIALALYVVTLGFRLWDITADTPQPDEHHWLSRAHDALVKFEAEGYRRYNTHLGHPGIPAVWAMMTATAVADRWNERRGFTDNSPGYVNHLVASRIALAVGTSLLIPLLFLALLPLLDSRIAFGSALLLAFDPSQTTLARLAHIDATLTFLVTALLLLYALGERTERLGLKTLFKLSAGICWGFAIATKPTAGFIIPGLLLYRAVRKVLLRRIGMKYALFTWSDMWLLVTGHVVFALLYTRLWQTNSRYVKVYSLDNAITRQIASLGREFAAHPFLAGGLLFGTVALAAYLLLFRWRGGHENVAVRRLQRAIGMIALLLAVAIFALMINPNIPQNILRFWMWAAGLSEVEHRSYGYRWDPPSWGYLGLVVTKLPLLAVLGLLVSVLAALTLPWKQMYEREEIERTALPIMFLLCAVVWCALLSVSSKVTFRYVAPVVPGLYIASAFGLDLLRRRFLVARLTRFGSRPVCLVESGHGKRIVDDRLGNSLLCMAILLQFAAVLTWRPNFAYYGNLFSGGVEEEVRSKRPMPLAGTADGLRFLVAEAKRRDRELAVMVLGDIDILSFTHRQLHRDPATRKLLQFVPFTGFSAGDVLFVSPGFQSRLPKIVGTNIEQLTRIFEYKIDGVPVLVLYDVPTPTYFTPLPVEVRTFLRAAGDREPLTPDGPAFAIGDTSRHQAGYLMFGRRIRVEMGEFELMFPVGTFGHIEQMEDRVKVTSGPETRDINGQHRREVVRLEFGSGCTRTVYQDELPVTGLSNFAFRCTFSDREQLQLRVLWIGDVNAIVGDGLLKQIR